MWHAYGVDKGACDMVYKPWFMRYVACHQEVVLPMNELKKIDPFFIVYPKFKNPPISPQDFLFAVLLI